MKKQSLQFQNRNLNVFSKAHLLNYFSYKSRLFCGLSEVLMMESCLVPGQPPAIEQWLIGQSVSMAQLGTCAEQTQNGSEVLTDSPYY